MKINNMDECHIKGAAEIVLLYKKENNKPYSQQDRSQLEGQLKLLITDNSSLTLVALEDGIVIGFINGHICPFPIIMGKECYISDLLIHPGYRGRQTGKMLLNSLEEKSGKLGVKRLMLNNSKDAESYKRSFYAKNGFTERNNFSNFVKEI